MMGETDGADGVRSGWPLYEVFLRGKRGLNHVHVGVAARRRRADGAAPRA